MTKYENIFDAAKIFKESGYVLTNPDWFYENDFSEPQKYLNVMFR